ERHAGSRRRLFEHHRKRAVAQRLVDLVALEALLDPACSRNQMFVLVERKIADLQKMPGRGGGHRGRAGYGGSLSGENTSTGIRGGGRRVDSAPATGMRGASRSGAGVRSAVAGSPGSVRVDVGAGQQMEID